MCRRNHLAGAVHIVVVAIDLDQARVGRNSIHIVVPLSVDFNESIIVRIHLKLQMSRLIKVIESLSKSSVIRIGYPVTTIFNCRIVAGKIIVVSVLCLVHTSTGHTVDRVISISV